MRIGSLCAALAMVAVPWPSVAAGEPAAPASFRFAKRDTKHVPDFQKHVVPLLGRLGCNSANCHGSFQGRGGFRLSLFGSEFETDLAAVTGKATAENVGRVQPLAAAKSLLVRKPTRQVAHKGGEIVEQDSWQHHLLLRWIESGAKGAPQPRRLDRLDVTPREVLFKSKGERTRLKVIAVWADGEREDVTGLCRYRVNDDTVALVDGEGAIEAVGRGDTHVVAFYDNGVVAIPVLRPVSDAPTRKAAAPPASVDGFVEAKLAKLGIEPSPPCTDAEFLSRVSIDLTGTLPAPDEVEQFLADRRTDKRTRKIDDLLERPAYAAWWANKLCDFTGCNPAAITDVTEVGQAQAVQWYEWIHRRVADNAPYDKLVEGIVLSVGRAPGQSADEYAAEMTGYVRTKSPVDFATRATMPHYWTRASVKEPKDKALAFAHGFLGIQLQCAQCHKHPFDQWTQPDFTDFARFFDDVAVRGGRVGFPQFAQAKAGTVIRWPELVVNERANPLTLSLLRSGEVTLSEKDDPRKPILDWMRAKDNPWFARAFVNRVWAGYFHVGIVDPPDALTPANPPSHPELLDHLTRGFVSHGYDMKWLHRAIATSAAYQRSWKPTDTNRHDRRNFSRAIPRRIPAEVVYDALKQATAATDKLDVVRSDLKRRAIGHLSMRMAGTHAMNVFGKPDRALNCDCERVNVPSLSQAVFLQNDPLVRGFLNESGWIEEIRSASRKPDRDSLIKQAWLRALGRPPREEETARAREHLADATDTAEGVRDLLWALVNTKEFLLNH
jgi:Protein of unknown function (DUF1549)/Protein of unknown function (DUF1553)